MSERPGLLTVNDRAVDLQDVPDEERLLDTIRWRLGLRGTKDGCRSGECGACTVLVGGKARLSCLVLTRELPGATVTTVEAVERDPVGAVVQRAFAEEGGLQCGYCTPGFVMATTALLRASRSEGNGPALDDAVRLGGNLCRCTGYASIARAVARAREALR